MTITVRLPGALRQWADGQRTVQLHENSVGDAIRALCRTYPAVGQRVLDEEGQAHGFVNMYVNGEDVRLLQGTQTPLVDGDELVLAPAVAGGA